MRYLLLIALLVAALAACGGDDDDGGSAGPTEESLSETAQEFGEAFAGDNTGIGAYRFYHESFREKCPQDDFAGLMLLVRGFYPELADAEYRLESVTVDGDRGQVVGDFYVDDRSLGWSEDEEEYEEYWIYEDGKWWAATDDPMPCETSVTTDRQ
jgi:hypothetical protein